MRYVIFKKSEVFNHTKLWTMEQIIHKFPRTTSEIVYIDHITVRASDGRALQEGMMIEAKDEEDAIKKYRRVLNG